MFMYVGEMKFFSIIIYIRYLAYQAVHAPREVPPSYVTPYDHIIEDSERRTFAVIKTTSHLKKLFHVVFAV